MKLYLVRHAIAEPGTARRSDAERALTEEGRKKMEQAARGLASFAAPDRILTSPLRRARETAEIVAASLQDVEIAVLPELAGGALPNAVLAALKPHLGVDSLALVGHQPDLGQLASALLTGSPSACPLPFRKGSVACFDGEITPGGSVMELEWFLTPKQLRALGHSGEAS